MFGELSLAVRSPSFVAGDGVMSDAVRGGGVVGGGDSVKTDVKG